MFQEGGRGNEERFCFFLKKSSKKLTKRLHSDQGPELKNMKTIQKSVERRKNEGAPFRKSGGRLTGTGHFSQLPPAAVRKWLAPSNDKHHMAVRQSLLNPFQFIEIDGAGANFQVFRPLARDRKSGQIRHFLKRFQHQILMDLVVGNE